jgi:3-hydroxyacyl-CoA dehydrogenase / 3-hydroxy-2-methylbutyryl-CoA dehydrogenase
MKIENCVAIVTGGASGLGEACVRNIITSGGRVAILDIDTQRGEKLAGELSPNVHFVFTDITKEESTRAAIDKAVDAFGMVSVAINCAGVARRGNVFSKDQPSPLEAFNQVIQINLVGTYNVDRLAALQMVKNTPNEDGERGVIINTASIAAFDGQSGNAAYASSKAGIVGLTLPIARECGQYGIRVMAIAPGVFKTPITAGLSEEGEKVITGMQPFPKRLGKPEEFAQLVRQIIENPMLNGEVIRLDAGIRGIRNPQDFRQARHRESHA